MQNKEVKKKLKASKIFERGKGDWDKLYNFMDENDFSASDFMACVCANLLSLLRLKWQVFKTELMIEGVKFKITIEPEIWSIKEDEKKSD